MNILKIKFLISDDVTVDLKEYYTECDEKVYDSISGKVDTCYSGEFPVKLSAKDEAGNEGSLDFVLKLNPVHVTKENPILLYMMESMELLQSKILSMAIFMERVNTMLNLK